MFEFELPDLGEGVAEGEVLAWHVELGDTVHEDDVLAEVETDKAAVDVPSPVDGVVRELHAEVGDIIETGEVLVSIEEGATSEQAEASAASEKTTEPGTEDGESRTFAPPSVRRLAREKGVDITTVDGSGPSGRITESDVEAAASGRAESDEPTSVVSKVDAEERDDGQAVKSAVRKVSAEESADRRDRTLATPATRRLARELGVDIDAVPTDQSRDGEPYVDAAAVRAVAEREAPATQASTEPANTGVPDEAVREVTETVVSELREMAGETGESATETREDRREPYAGIRRTIGEQMARSRAEVPHATHHDKVAVTGLVEARERLQPLAEKRGVHLTYTPLLLRCVAAALNDHPVLASQLDTDEEEIVYRGDRDIGVATATDHGLVVPVVENVDEKGLLELAADLNDLVDRARSRDLSREELQGGVFTVTNFGAIGGEYADPIINVPETAILGVGALKERPVVEDGEAGDTSDRTGGETASSGEVVARPTLTLSLAIDHRVIDGAEAAEFVNTLKSYLADPTRLLLE